MHIVLVSYEQVAKPTTVKMSVFHAQRGVRSQPIYSTVEPQDIA